MGQRFLLTAGLLLLGLPTGVCACTCSNAAPGACGGLQKDDVVFLGTVTGMETVSPTTPAPANAANSASDSAGDTPLIKYHFRIDERFAGPDAAEIDIYSGGEDGDCGYRFQNGEQYVVYTHQGTEGRLFATICSGTRSASDALALIPQLRAMRDGRQVASVFGIIRRADPPLLAPSDDPDDPLPGITLRLRSVYDRFETSSGPGGVYSFYDVHAGEYRFTAALPARTEMTERGLGTLPPFKIPDGACYEYDVDALPTGQIRGSIVGPAGKPLTLASVELYRLGEYSNSRPGLWGFQGRAGYFDFDHVGPGDYILVFNRLNRPDPNAPFTRSFYPGVADVADATPIRLKDGQQLLNLKLRLEHAYPTRRVRVRLSWQGGRPAGDVTVTAQADEGANPAAERIAPGLYQFTVLDSAHYKISAWEDVDPRRLASRNRSGACPFPARIAATPVELDGAKPPAKEVALVLPQPDCIKR